MKRKLPQQVTLPSSSPALAAAEFATKNLRSKIPRRKRSHISPIILNSSSNYCDDLSCNTTLESAVLHNHDVVPKKNKQEQQQPQVSVSERSCVESCSAVVAATAEADSNQNGAVSFSVVQHSPANTTATVEQKSPEVNSCDSGGYYVTGILADDDLECNESFSELQSEFSSSSNGNGGCNSQYEDYTDDYTPSIWTENDSGSQFSERSCDDESAPSPCFSLFQEFKQQFMYLNSEYATDDDDFEVSSLNNDHYTEELAYWKFEDEEYEESYKLLRSRERNEAAKVTNYIEEYQNETVFGGVIIEQRLLMVNWIIQLSRNKDLQSETVFLGVRLFDRFLSKGCFATRRNLQILGIACLTLAIRIEENQPYNSVRQKCFRVGSNVYSKTEVVAMEWMVQEVLKFHCISATVYNFLWFYLKAAEANEQMQKKAEYLASLTLLDYMQLRFWPSSVAAAVVILVLLSAEQDELCQRIMEVHVRTKIDDLSECIKLGVAVEARIVNLLLVEDYGSENAQHGTDKRKKELRRRIYLEIERPHRRLYS